MGLHPIRVLSVCTGGAGLDRGLRAAEPAARLVCAVEIEAFACGVLAAQMESGALDQAPIWTDARTFRGEPWRGAVDMLVAGFPCQDISSDGKRAGIHGARSGLWFDVARIGRDVGARIWFLENVDSITVRGIDAVLGTLAESRFDAVWDVFSAAEVGAPHLRERWFGLAVAQPESRGQRIVREPPGSAGQLLRRGDPVDDTDTRRRGRQGDAVRPGRDRPGRTGSNVGDAERGGHDGRALVAGRGAVERIAVARSGEGVANTDSRRLGAGGRPERLPPHVASGIPTLAYPAAQRRGEAWGHSERPEEWLGIGLPTFPPDRADMRAWAEVQTGFEPAVCRLADGLDVGLRTDWLRLLGNGVVPQQAAHAYRILRGRLMEQGLWPL